ncbi:MAG: ATPase domain-containing protein, partial [Cyanobacteria bacterium P01_D01_bin.123]
MSGDETMPPNPEQTDSVTPSDRAIASLYPDSLYPKSAAVSGIPKIRTSIEGFDDISHGGLPMGRTTLVSGTSGTGKTLFCLQFLYNGIRHFA